MEGMEKLRYFGPYEILEELGRGSTGIVFKTRRKSHSRLFALKTIVPKPGEDWAIQLERFYREIRAVASCNHPNIVYGCDADQYGDSHFFVREFVEGATLRQHMEQRLLSAREASKVVELVTRPVHYLHSQGLIRRNLTPDNVLIAQDGTVKLIGFGKVFLMGGSPPESVATDIQALGVMLYHLMTREYWFPEGRLPDELAKICLRCASTEPENQYHSALELGEDLRRYWRNA
jgi:serine/threonine-protein kinase